MMSMSMVEKSAKSLSPEPDGKILTVKKLLSDSSLVIPQYQRPYKWTEKNVNQLFSDIATHKRHVLKAKLSDWIT